MDKLRQFDVASENSALRAVGVLPPSTSAVRQTPVVRRAVSRPQEYFLRFLGKRRRV
jgi:hypothetical protein